MRIDEECERVAHLNGDEVLVCSNDPIARHRTIQRWQLDPEGRAVPMTGGLELRGRFKTSWYLSTLIAAGPPETLLPQDQMSTLREWLELMRR